MAIAKNELGNQYGDLTVIALAPYKQNNKAVWTCQCKCGNQVKVLGKSLRNGNTKSCGSEETNYAMVKKLTVDSVS